jgi:hypothetical protein
MESCVQLFNCLQSIRTVLHNQKCSPKELTCAMLASHFDGKDSAEWREYVFEINFGLMVGKV